MNIKTVKTDLQKEIVKITRRHSSIHVTRKSFGEQRTLYMYNTLFNTAYYNIAENINNYAILT